MRVVGIMSGTSLDGIDVADVELERRGERLHHHIRNFLTVPLGLAMRAALFESLPPNAGSNHAVAELDYAMGEALADAVLRALQAWRVEAVAVDLIGSHGLTLYHAPDDGATLQIGEAAVIAARTGITCVSDFRAADVAVGGQGAPLVPFVDRELFASPTEHRAVLNIGGIANVTLIPPAGNADEITAFDTGPGNMLVDQAIRTLSKGELHFDRDGELAASGSVDRSLLDELMQEPFFALAPPKSTGRETFGPNFSERVARRARSRGLADVDLIATLTALTAASVAEAIPSACARVIVSGGGARNPTMMAMLKSELDRRSLRAVVDRSDTHGVDADQKEALAFAILAFEALHGRSNHLPRCTGARSNVILGKLTAGANYQALMSVVWRDSWTPANGIR
jgi:anhydro-N-acetylmuramic acid kinase